jgi:hypothetical protein
MATETDGRVPDDTRAAREVTVAMAVVWLVGVARAFRVDAPRDVDQEVRAAQVDLIQAIQLACADGLPISDVRARFIDPVLRHVDANGGAGALLAETVQFVERQPLTRASAA